MIFHYLDASAWVKRYYLETGTDWVQGLFAQNQIIACASLGFIEVMATLSRKRKAQDIATLQFKQKALELEDDWKHFIQMHMSAETVDIAKELTKKLSIRGADAVHLASALILKNRFKEKNDRLIFVASDHELKEAAKSSELDVIDPAEQ